MTLPNVQSLYYGLTTIGLTSLSRYRKLYEQPMLTKEQCQRWELRRLLTRSLYVSRYSNENYCPSTKLSMTVAALTKGQELPPLVSSSKTDKSYLGLLPTTKWVKLTFSRILGYITSFRISMIV